MPRVVSQIVRRLKRGQGSGPSVPSSNITDAPNLPWASIGDSETHLLEELKSLYWQGVKCELEVILLTLKKWQEPEYSLVVLDDEDDDFIHGFDTFIDQVSQESRAFASRYGMPVLTLRVYRFSAQQTPRT
jgi:hypothetical protein